MPDRLFVGIDASAAGLREFSGRGARAGLDNLLYVRAAVEDLPRELAAVADRLTVVLPWGSLLAAAARPSVAVLRGIRALCRDDAVLTAVISVDATRDQAEARRLGLPPFEEEHLRGALADGYADAGFTITTARALAASGLARWPSTWARRLAHGRPRSVVQIDARATRAATASG